MPFSMFGEIKGLWQNVTDCIAPPRRRSTHAIVFGLGECRTSNKRDLLDLNPASMPLNKYTAESGTSTNVSGRGHWRALGDERQIEKEAVYMTTATMT